MSNARRRHLAYENNIKRQRITELGQRDKLVMFTLIVDNSTVGIVDNIDTGTLNTVHGVR